MKLLKENIYLNKTDAVGESVYTESLSSITAISNMLELLQQTPLDLMQREYIWAIQGRAKEVTKLLLAIPEANDRAEVTAVNEDISEKVNIYNKKTSNTFQCPVSPTLKGARILVADDNELNLVLAKAVLERWEVDCDVARNGLEAVEKVKVSDYDIVLMDLQMPVLDGYEATMQIRQLPLEINKTVPIIAFTSLYEYEIAERLEAVGFTDYVNKPFQPEMLYGKLKLYYDKAYL